MAEEPKRLPVCGTDYDATDDTCPKASPHVPKFQANATASSLDYPIYQQIVCNVGKLILTCPQADGVPLVIHVYGAYYGIQHDTAVKQCLGALSGEIGPGGGEIPKMCFFSNTFAKMQTLCENKELCMIDASVNKLGDPCPHFNKQLFIQYQCMDRSELQFLNANCGERVESKEIPFVCPLAPNANATGEIFERTWCDGSSMNIQCGFEGNETIEILCAFYGIHTSLTSCNIQNLANPPICYLQSSFEYVATTCDGNSTCTIDSFTTTFSDPCIGFDKALYVQWKCI